MLEWYMLSSCSKHLSVTSRSSTKWLSLGLRRQCHTEYLACAESVRRAGLSVATETLVTN